MSPVLDYLGDKNSATLPSNRIDANGVLVQAKKDKLDDKFAEWGSLIQYYELTNEPCMSLTNSSFAVDKAIASYIPQASGQYAGLRFDGDYQYVNAKSNASIADCRRRSHSGAGGEHSVYPDQTVVSGSGKPLRCCRVM